MNCVLKYKLFRSKISKAYYIVSIFIPLETVITMKEIILASASPRRHELLELIGITHSVIPCTEEEGEVKNGNSKADPKNAIKTTIEESILQVACQKAMCVAKTLPTNKRNSLVIGADTIVVLNDEIIGKPKSEDDAFVMLKKLTGNVHEVYTGLCIYDFEKDRIHTAVERTLVSMIPCSDNRIAAYLASEKVQDKAGAYAIQGIGATLIDRIEGCFYNVMGLPLSRFRKILDEIGYPFLSE